MDKLTLETAALKRDLAVREELSEQRQADIKQYRSEIKQLQADIASDEKYLLKNTLQKSAHENMIKLYESEQRSAMAEGERQNLQITLNEIKRLQADEVERKSRLEHLEVLLNK